MSYDVDVFSVDRPVLPTLPEGRGWQIVADGPLSVEPEDIPIQVRSSLPGLKFLTQFHLEGKAPVSALKKLRAISQKLARDARGVVVDQQENTVETPRGVQRLVPQAKQKDETLLHLLWFVGDVAALIKAAPAGLIDLFQRSIPECLPRRYGMCDPPEFKLEVEGLAHFRHFVEQHLRYSMVWVCHKPCRDVVVSVPDRVGATPRGFRCGCLKLDIDGNVAEDPAWRLELTQLWISVADLILPFYAEIRIGPCPTMGWWWNGIPATTPSAMLISDPYLDLWPEFAEGALSSPNGLFYRERFSNLDGAGRVELPAPPAAIAKPPDRPMPAAFDASNMDLFWEVLDRKIQYPEIWPFESPFSELGT